MTEIKDKNTDAVCEEPATAHCTDEQLNDANTEPGEGKPVDTVVQESPETIKRMAKEKLEKELKDDNNKHFSKLVIGYLQKRCEDDLGLSEDVVQTHKTWKKCYDYIYGRARKLAKGNCAAVSDDVVYEWAEDYFHLDDKAAEEKKAKEEAERKKKAAERAKQNKNKPAGLKTEKTAKPETSSTPKKADDADTKPQPKPKPKKNELDGQMDLFSMLDL